MKVETRGRLTRRESIILAISISWISRFERTTVAIAFYFICCVVRSSAKKNE